MPRKPRMFCSCLTRLPRMAHTFGSHGSHVWLAGSHIGHTREECRTKPVNLAEKLTRRAEVSEQASGFYNLIFH